MSEIVGRIGGKRTTEQEREKKRRQRSRSRSKTTPTGGQDGGTISEQAISNHGMHQNVICGHCGLLFKDLGKARIHVEKECKARESNASAVAKRGECCVDSSEQWNETPCLCACHYTLAPSWSITANGIGLSPHRHQDSAGKCSTCGAESDQRRTAANIQSDAISDKGSKSSTDKSRADTSVRATRQS